MTRVLLISSNGTGLGHLTRSMAIARRLDEDIEPILLTMSKAADVAREQGLICDHYPSPQAASTGPRRWDRGLERRLRETIELQRPAVLVFDGVHPYRGVVKAIKRASGLTAVWCRRAMWQPGAGARYLRRAKVFDAVLEPGELAASEDRGPTSTAGDGAIRVGPIVFLAENEVMPRERAAAELGLDPARPAALIHLGAGGPEIEAIAARCVERLGRDPNLQVAVLESAIHAAKGGLPANVTVLRATYPIARFYAAFDFAVSAAGYNAFHELIRFGLPTLWLPMTRQLDDQPARARWAEQAGVGLSCEETGDGALEDALDGLNDPARRTEMRTRLAALPMQDGAADAARVISELARAG